jgi:diaminohydroxyphosphoribosylaminopyrimidine deaminase/5-amino-6-(5-phosphoribosylamino)uracil reductase
VSNDERFMRLALSLGKRGQGNAWPNPAVGCVIVRDDRIVGRGWTQPGGRPHAEPQALAQAGDLSRGATAYVTLEPCAHQGQTPPCAQALIDAGVVRVVSPIADNDARVRGQGFDMLRAAGIKVETGLLSDEAMQDHAGFFQRNETGRPWLTLKLASSFDGRIATASGDSQWITGPAARQLVQSQRARHDAVMVGGGTARADDPSLNVRAFTPPRQPVRVLVSRHLDLPLMGNLARSARDIPVWICHGPNADPNLIEAWTGMGATLLECRLTGGQVDAVSVLEQLGAQGLTRVFCEGGGMLAASLLLADVVDELIGFTAGVALGAEGRPALGALGLERLAQAPRFDLIETRQIGVDVLHRWQRSAG